MPTEPALADGRLPTPQTAKEYSFPMTPYDIQLDFMRRLFETIENGDFGIFESPTGTGKSLSIICGALTWLQHNSERPPARELPTTDAPAWVVEFERKRLNQSNNGDAGDKYDSWVKKVRSQEQAMQRRSNHRHIAGSSTAGLKRKAEADSDSELVVDAYYSDDMAGKPTEDNVDDGEVRYSDNVRRLLQQRAENKPYFDSSDESDLSDNGGDGGPPEEPNVTKIYYASRTHSQLQQFVGEIRRTEFARRGVKCVSLGSRWQLCINDSVRHGCKAVHPINERCLEMQQNPKKKRCPSLPALQTPMLDFKDSIGSKIMDIEDLAKEGRKAGVCPYYGSRNAVRAAQVVALPYNMLLSRSARESMGVSLKDHVVIVDEAHNLVDTILAIHSVTIDLHTVAGLEEMVQMYFSKYWRRLKGSNTVYIRQTLALLKALRKYMHGVASGGESTSVLSVNDFLQRAHADHINVYKIDRYLRESKLGRKLNMFSDRRHLEELQAAPKRGRVESMETAGSDKPAILSAPASGIASLEAFMECIGRPDRTGARLVVRTLAKDKPTVELKYLLLDPSEAFGEIRREARAVILAGGTIKPATDIVEQLLPDIRRMSTEDTADEHRKKLDPQSARLFAWEHVVARSHIKALVVDSGPTGQPMRFTFQDQSDMVRIRDAGLALASLCNVIPAGVVAFFPSYALLGKMFAEWTKHGIIQRIERKKPVFCESHSANLQDMLPNYMKRVHAPGSTGAVLLSVVGGKLSEGINFSDDLGRAVVMIGVPFPSLASPELAERIAFYESMGKPAGTAPSGVAAGKMGPRGRELYESLCMRAVNQSIGRAIRHKNDYAAIVFLDSRYADSRISSKLPSWMAHSSTQPGQKVEHMPFGPAVARIAAFFRQDFSH
ncbi:ATP-dependent DNA helicase chl1 [Linderina pennispora]|nr:ATP-dependent DNA helicase chl1 [Linderina pennispora]